MTHIGVTGHQRLQNPESWVWVEEKIRIQLRDVAGPIVGVTSLAIGADQLFARLVLERKGTLHVVLPFADIERSFGIEDVRTFRELLKGATVETLDVRGDDEEAYLAAGKRVVDSSHLMFAIWDGKPAKGKGGTADIVEYTVSRGVPLVRLDPIDRIVTNTLATRSPRK